MQATPSAASSTTSTERLKEWSDVAKFAGRIVAYKYEAKRRESDNFTFGNSKKYFGLISDRERTFAGWGRPKGYTLTPFVKTKKNSIFEDSLTDERLEMKSLKMRIATLEEVKGLKANSGVKAYFPSPLNWDFHIDLATKDMERTSAADEKKADLSDLEKVPIDDAIEKGTDFLAAISSYFDILSGVSAPSKSSDDSVDSNKMNLFGETLLILACTLGEVGITNYLLNKGTDVQIKMQLGTTAMHAAAFKGSLGCVKALYEKDPTTAEAKSKDGSSVLYCASEHGHANVVSFLINEANVDLHYADDKGMTALLIAARYGHREVVEMLYNKDPSTMKAKDKEGKDAYVLARSLDVIAFLLAIPELDVEKTKATERLVWNS